MSYNTLHLVNEIYKTKLNPFTRIEQKVNLKKEETRTSADINEKINNDEEFNLKLKSKLPKNDESLFSFNIKPRNKFKLDNF